jgi:hypothetical protein
MPRISTVTSLVHRTWRNLHCPSQFIWSARVHRTCGGLPRLTMPDDDRAAINRSPRTTGPVRRSGDVGMTICTCWKTCRLRPCSGARWSRPVSPMAKTTTKLNAQDRVILFCAATGIGHVAVGIRTRSCLGAYPSEHTDYVEPGDPL